MPVWRVPIKMNLECSFKISKIVQIISIKFGVLWRFMTQTNVEKPIAVKRNIEKLK